MQVASCRHQGDGSGGDEGGVDGFQLARGAWFLRVHVCKCGGEEALIDNSKHHQTQPSHTESGMISAIAVDVFGASIDRKECVCLY